MHSYLSIKPLKELPNVLIYNPKNTPIYNMGSPFFGNSLGTMVAYPMKKNNKNFLWIELLLIHQRRCGFGTFFLNFAQQLSKQLGCNGDIRLLAASTIYETKAPHAFYRKYGFSSDNKKILKQIDKSIKKNKPLSYIYTPATEMYYPENKSSKMNFLQKMLKKLGL